MPFTCTLSTVIDFPTPEERKTEAKRLLEGLNGQWVADRMGVSKAKVSRWKRGERAPSLEDLLRLPAATNRPLHPALSQRLFGHQSVTEIKETAEASG